MGVLGMQVSGMQGGDGGDNSTKEGRNIQSFV